MAASDGGGRVVAFPDPWVRPDYVLSDQNLAECFKAREGDAFCYSHARRSWRRFDGQRWLDDQLMALDSKIQEFLKKVAPAARSPRDRLRIGSSNLLGSVERELRAMLSVQESEFDADPWLMNFPGGTLDLRYCSAPVSLRPHRREDRLTKLAAANPGGAAPMWLEFIEFVCCGDAELGAYLQQLAGYALAGVADEQIFAFLYGGGSNGKSVFVETLLRVLGDYGVTCPAGVFTARPFEQHPEELMALRGARLVVASEVAANAKWNEQRIKMVTGGERIRARYMRENSVEFANSATLIVSGNHKPELHAVDDAIRRRMHIVPFRAKVSVEGRDKQMGDKLMSEAGGILAWMVEGCRLWRQSRGLILPEAVARATEDYIADEDHIEQWVLDCCYDGRKDERDRSETKTGALYASWKRWAEAAGISPGSINPFSTKLGNCGFERYRAGRERGFKKITLRPETWGPLMGG